MSDLIMTLDDDDTMEAQSSDEEEFASTNFDFGDNSVAASREDTQKWNFKMGAKSALKSTNNSTISDKINEKMKKNDMIKQKSDALHAKKQAAKSKDIKQKKQTPNKKKGTSGGDSEDEDDEEDGVVLSSSDEEGNGVVDSEDEDEEEAQTEQFESSFLQKRTKSTASKPPTATDRKAAIQERQAMKEIEKNKAKMAKETAKKNKTELNGKPSKPKPKPTATADDEEEEEDDDEEEGVEADFDSDGDDNMNGFLAGAGKVSKKPLTPTDKPDVTAFTELKLSRALLKACETVGFSTPTAIQSRAIPIAMTGRDILANAVTGSGKTAAFLLPVLERLLYRSRRVPATRVVILTPTRELAAQIQSMCEQLGQFTDVRSCLVVGGMSLKVQEQQLRTFPDIVIATPGRIIDHMRNSQSFHLDNVEVLILDEADRLLELNFKEEVEEIVKGCPEGRQTMLFSATLSQQVDQLASLSLNKPARISATPTFTIADKLIQEFVRIRSGKESDREAILMCLCTRTFKKRCIVFFKTKAQTHRFMIIFGLAQLRAAELHGNLTQVQRMDALDQFQNAEVDFLLATDLAARGLDIKNVNSVINYELPQDLRRYVHRVGRTARAGGSGRAVTLVLESQRKQLKEIIKRAQDEVKSRQVPPDAVDLWRQKIADMEPDIRDIFTQERIEKDIRLAEMEANKANNLIDHAKDIQGRPKRTWFQSAHAKAEAKSQRDDDVDSRFDRGMDGIGDEENGNGNEDDKSKSQKKNEKRRQKKADKNLAAKQKANLKGKKVFPKAAERQDILAQVRSARAAKSKLKPKRLHEEDDRQPRTNPDGSKRPNKKRKPAKPASKANGSSFASEAKDAKSQIAKPKTHKRKSKPTVKSFKSQKKHKRR